jgi:two-component system, chemotaxis family, CheB/CheR fusion protein
MSATPASAWRHRKRQGDLRGLSPGRQGAALSGQGLGLGLSIVQRLADLMEHPVSVRSTPGKGRLHDHAAAGRPAAEVPAPPRPAAGSPVAPRQTGTILLVEDEDRCAICWPRS